MLEGDIVAQTVAEEQAPADDSARGRFARIYQALRSRICLLDYPPGKRLREEDLAEEFGVSRTPVRRVLVKLEAEGLLRSVHGVGTIVTDIDAEELAQVYEIRVELAELIGKLSPVEVNEELIEKFRDIRARCEQLTEGSDVRQFAWLNMEFFHLFTSLTRNEPLRELSERLYYQTSRIWMKTALQIRDYQELLDNEFRTFQREVADIAEAVEHGDVAAAAYVRRVHIALSYARIRRAFAENS